MAPNTTEPKIRDQFGSLVDNPYYSRTATPSIASQMAANDAAVKASVDKKASELAFMSTDLGANYVQKDQATLDRLGGFTSPTAVTTPTKPNGTGTTYSMPDVNGGGTKATPGKIKYINLDGQTTELNGSAITPEAVQELMNQGYYSLESTGEVPTWATTGDVQGGRMSAELAAAKKSKDDLIAGMAKFMVTDEALAGQLKAIEAQYEARITDMQDINKRRTASLQTTGMRLGSRYSGGVFGGIVSEEERQGVQRISQLEGDKQAAISAAKEAARSNNWKIYAEQVSYAEKAYQDQIKSVTEFNKNLVEKNKVIAEEAKKAREHEVQASRDTAIGGLMAQGITDPLKILGYLNGAGGDFTAKEIADGIKNLQMVEESAPGVVGEWQAALREGGIPEGTTLMDYMDIKEPGRALDMRYKQAQIAKIESELGGGGILNPSNNKIIPSGAVARKINKEVADSDAYKAITKGQDSLQFLGNFEELFNKVGATSAVFSPRQNSDLASRYNPAILNLKEFFNLGVLNGPDESILRKVLPDPTGRSAALTGGSLGIYLPSAATKSGLVNMKKMIETTLDERFSSLQTQYGDYDSDSIDAMRDATRKYVKQKAMLNPKIAQLVEDHPEYTPEEILQVIK